MKKVFKEFREFIARGNVLDMAIGVIIAGAFGKITTSLVNNILMPFISYLFGTRDMTALDLVVRPEVLAEDGTVAQEAIVIGFGTLLATIIDFLLIALVICIIVKTMNSARARAEAKKKAAEAAAPAEPPAPPAPSAEEVLLTEIRDLLKQKN